VRAYEDKLSTRNI